MNKIYYVVKLKPRISIFYTTSDLADAKATLQYLKRFKHPAKIVSFNKDSFKKLGYALKT
jgi:hypothetical protein